MCLISIIYWVFPSANPSKRHGRNECGRIDLGSAERGDEPEDNQFCGHCDGRNDTSRSSGGGALTTHTDIGANISIVVRGRSGNSPSSENDSEGNFYSPASENNSGVGNRARSENSPSGEERSKSEFSFKSPSSENSSSSEEGSKSELIFNSPSSEDNSSSSEGFKSQVSFDRSSSGDRSSSNNDGSVGQSRAAAVQFQPLPPRVPPAVASQPGAEERSPTRRIPGSFEG